jgi:undecaprenyl-diphosphatase
MTIKQAIILALIQGITEFLPISSSGHLVLARNLLGINNIPILFDLILHLGTVTATIIVYYKVIGCIFKDIGTWIFSINAQKKRNINVGNVKLFFFILISAAVTAIIGVLFKNRITSLFYNTSIVSVFLIITGLILFLSRFKQEGGKGINEISIPVPVAIGATQAFAMLPGISRSGCTISAGLFMGLNREFAALYSFLLSIPSVIGAAVFEYIRSSQYLYEQVSIPVMAAAFFLSLITGYAALKSLLRFVKRGKLYIFSFYCFCAGAAGLIL